MTIDIALVLTVLAATIVIFVTDFLRVDVTALIVMVALPWLGLIEPEDAFRGLSSGAVVSIMAVVIMGHGLELTGVTHMIARPLSHLAGGSSLRLRAALFGSAGFASAFMQNVGAAAIFLPVGARLAKSNGLRVSQLLMPLGFAAILGGTLTMIGSSPLIVLNDLVASHGQERFGIFAVTPIGVTLLVSGVALFVFFGAALLPKRKEGDDTQTDQREVLKSWSLLDHIVEVMVPEDSALIGMTRQQAHLIDRFGVHVLAVRELGRTLYAPSTNTRFAAGQRLALLGAPEEIERIVSEVGLRLRPRVERFALLVGSENAGYAEVLVSPRASIIGKSMREMRFRKMLGVEPLTLLSGGEVHPRAFAERPLRAGDMVLVHGSWERIRHIGTDRDFVLLTRNEGPVVKNEKRRRAVLCFVVALGLAVAGASLPVALLSGAIGMILLGVMKIDEAYRAVSWRTVFLLAGLIPLGIAMESTGAAAYLAGELFGVLQGAPTLVVLLTIACITTLFTLFMSNVAATVVLVPLVMGLAPLVELDPRALALLVGICAQNSFLLPTHQVNALLMAPGGYRTGDYLKSGIPMTLLFLVIAVGGIRIFWL